jgi:hypothetical protein
MIENMIRRSLFDKVMAGVTETDEYFVQKLDALGCIGLSTLQKCVAAHRMLCYSLPADAVDEYVRIGESTALESFKVTACDPWGYYCNFL